MEIRKEVPAREEVIDVISIRFNLRAKTASVDYVANGRRNRKEIQVADVLKIHPDVAAKIDAVNEFMVKVIISTFDVDNGSKLQLQLEAAVKEENDV